MGEVGNSRSNALQNQPTEQHHCSQRPSSGNLLKDGAGRIGITCTQEMAVAIHAAINASRLGWVHRS